MTKQEAIDYRNEGMRFYSGEGCEADSKKAHELFLKAAEGHDTVAAVHLGCQAWDEEDFNTATDWFQKAGKWYEEAGKPEDATIYVGYAKYLIGKNIYYNLDDKATVEENVRRQFAFVYLLEAYKMDNLNCLSMLGDCYYCGYCSVDGTPDYDKAIEIWQKGMDDGDQLCTLFLCNYMIENDKATPETIEALEKLVNDEENPCADACALLYNYYSWNGNEEKAEEWKERGLEMGSSIMQGIVDDEKEEEVGEDSWTAPETDTVKRVIEVDTDKCVIVVDTDGDFSIRHADASDWDSLPALIDADRTDNLRCNKFREVSKALGLKGTLLGLLDRDAFRKPDLEPNWHASQWYDGMADLYGDMIICMEDSGYKPMSFADEAEAQRVVDALKS